MKRAVSIEAAQSDSQCQRRVPLNRQTVKCDRVAQYAPSSVSVQWKMQAMPQSSVESEVGNMGFVSGDIWLPVAGEMSEAVQWIAGGDYLPIQIYKYTWIQLN